MPTRIRLRRMGRKKKPHYRIVVADSASPRDGRFVETLGYYKPLSHPARLVLDLERVDHWISEGANPSGTVKSLISRARRGGDATVALGEVDVEERKTKRAEKLAARRAAEVKVTQAEADSKEAAAAEAAIEASEAEESATEGEVAAEAEAEEEPVGEEGAAPEAEGEDEEAAEEPAAEEETEPTAEAGAEAEAEEAADEEQSE